MQIYLGKNEKVRSRHGLYFEVIDQLTRCLRGKYYRVFFDNLYTSVPVVKFLYAHKILSCGTLRQKRKYSCKEIKEPGKMIRGQHRSFQSASLNALSVVIWCDTKIVRFLSSLSDPAVVTTATRRVRSTHVRVNMPQAAAQYSRNYGGVDRFDALRSKKYGRISRPSKKMWKYLMWFLVNSAIVNSFILYQKTSTRPQKKRTFTHFDYHLELAKSLIAGFTSRKRMVTKPNYVGPTSRENAISHENVHMGVKRPKRCYAHKKFQPDGKPKRETVRGCKICGIHLCPECSIRWHSQ